MDECREKLYLKKNYSQKIKKELFSVKLKKNPGRQRPRNNSKKERHDNASNDNILTKVQIHYINFIRKSFQLKKYYAIPFLINIKSYQTIKIIIKMFMIK